MQFCDMVALNHSLPPDILHTVLLGYVTRLNGFAHLNKIGSDSHFLFSNFYKDEVKRDVLSVEEHCQNRPPPKRRQHK